MKPDFRLAGVVCGAGALTLMLSAPAVAAPAAVHAKDFAGYVATSPTGITSFTGSLTIPAITCPATGSPIMTVQVDLGGSSFQVLLGWQAHCASGSLSLPGASALFCSNSGQFCGPSAGVNAAPGDSIQFSMSENTKTTTTTVKLTNSTEKQNASASVQSLLSQPDIGVTTAFCCGNAQGNVTPIPSFTPIKFGNLKFNGAILSSFNPIREEMFDGTTLQVATSSVSSTGSFTNTFKHV
jgi:hypothetical protein